MNSFTSFRVVGRGAFGLVSAVAKVDTRVVYAMKEMDKRMIKGEDVFDLVENERNILCEITSPFCTQIK